MAKKKDLAGLVGGIIGKTATMPETTPTTATESGSAKSNKDKAAVIRATFVCDPELIRKIKYIGLASGRLHKDVVSDALSEYIARWETEHGTISLPPATNI